MGLPRTGTTSVCAAALSLGFKTAHTAYTKQTLLDAQFLADTPIFNDFERLLLLYPTAKFIYLERDSSTWLPSIKRLLSRMSGRLLAAQGGFFPCLKHAYGDVFSPLNASTLNDDTHLRRCYLTHQAHVKAFFERIDNPTLVLNLKHKESYYDFCEFLQRTPKQGFCHLNQGGKVTAWKQVRHPLKIESTRSGKADPFPFY